MSWSKVGHGILIAVACVGAAAGAVAASVPSWATAAGAVASASIAIVGVLGRYLPSAIDSVNITAAAAAKESP